MGQAGCFSSGVPGGRELPSTVSDSGTADAIAQQPTDGSSPDAASGCTSNDDCTAADAGSDTSTAEYCNKYGQCRGLSGPSCNTSLDCVSMGAICSSVKSLIKICVQCASDLDCQASSSATANSATKCVGTLCRKPCTSDIHCTVSNQLCASEASEGYCVPSCNVSADCPAGYSCDMSRDLCLPDM